MKALLRIELCALAAGVLALGTAAASDVTPRTTNSNAEAPIVLAQTTPAPATVYVQPAPDYPPLQAGVRRAAAEGPDALRQYIWRTRMIYAYYMPDWYN
jgi:hypothetical protein